MNETKFIEIRTRKMADWLSMFLIKEGYHANYKPDSFEELDRFFEEKIEFILGGENQNYLFAIASYIGEVLRYNYKAKWQNTHDEKTERSIYIEMKDKKKVYPFEIVAERLAGKIKIKDMFFEI